jgi:hypothetical protein
MVWSTRANGEDYDQLPFRSELYPRQPPTHQNAKRSPRGLCHAVCTMAKARKPASKSETSALPQIGDKSSPKAEPETTPEPTPWRKCTAFAGVVPVFRGVDSRHGRRSKRREEIGLAIENTERYPGTLDAAERSGP